MVKKIIIVAIIMIIAQVAVVAQADTQDILGVWVIIDDKDNKPTAYVYNYMLADIMYGKIIAIVDKETGLIHDTLVTRKEKAVELKGDPYICGLDIVHGMKYKNGAWKGSIIDPENGNTYDCTIKFSGNDLTVRGSLKGTGGLLGRNQTWRRVDSYIKSGIDQIAAIAKNVMQPHIPTKK